MVATRHATDKQIADLQRKVAAAAAALEQAKAARDAAIIAASRAGMPRRTVAELAGISYTRVQQIIDGK